MININFPYLWSLGHLMCCLIQFRQDIFESCISHDLHNILVLLHPCITIWMCCRFAGDAIDQILTVTFDLVNFFPGTIWLFSALIAWQWLPLVWLILILSYQANIVHLYFQHTYCWSRIKVR